MRVFWARAWPLVRERDTGLQSKTAGNPAPALIFLMGDLTPNLFLSTQDIYPLESTAVYF